MEGESFLGKLAPTTVGKAFCWFAVIVLLIIVATGHFRLRMVFPVGMLFCFGLMAWLEDEFQNQFQKVGIGFMGNEVIRSFEAKKIWVLIAVFVFGFLTLLTFLPEIVHLVSQGISALPK